MKDVIRRICRPWNSTNCKHVSRAIFIEYDTKINGGLKRENSSDWKQNGNIFKIYIYCLAIISFDTFVCISVGICLISKKILRLMKIEIGYFAIWVRYRRCNWGNRFTSFHASIKYYKGLVTHWYEIKDLRFGHIWRN